MNEAKSALFAVNGGGFADANFDGNGGTPLGITISKGKYITDASYSGAYGIIGIDKSNKLVLGKYSVEQTEELGIRDCVTFGPFLILDGQAQNTSSATAQSRASRTAIAQREDGIIFFLVLDGDRTKGEGATYAEEIEILQKYGAVNAANLDGGTSTCMTVNGTLVNDPTSMSGEHRTRELATAFVLTKDDSDDSDHSLVESKLK
jgi:exopolysaccharide biosynthesis protein